MTDEQNDDRWKETMFTVLFLILLNIAFAGTVIIMCMEEAP
jgi:hypothetical protein